MRLLLFLLILGQSLIAADDHGKVVKQYMDEYKEIAISEMYRTGIPASIKLAQGMLESNWGRSELATVANNHFGIKCGSNWSGSGFYKEDDDRDWKGKLIESCFRQFDSPAESYIAHSDFLTDDNKAYRYEFLFEYETTDYVAWAHGLKKSGYATDPKYPQKLISIIEKYELYKYDAKVSGRDPYVANKSKSTHTTTPSTTVRIASVTLPHERPVAEQERKTTETKRTTVFEKKAKAGLSTSRLSYSMSVHNDIQMVKAIGGETVGQLAAKVGLPLEDILTYNELYIQKEDILEPGAYVYLEKKKRKISDGPEYHVVQDGETMESISQLYGIRLKSLYAKNRMPKGSTTVVGQKLFLQETASLSERPKFRLADSSRKHAFLFEDDPTVN